VQDALGVGGGAFDLNAACAGFVYALITVAAMIDTGAFPKVLLIGADTLSPITDQDDRGTAVLFGDGAGAVLLESRPGRPLLLGSDLGADGSGVGILYCDHGGYISMDGREVYRRAVRATTDSARQAMKQAGVTSDEISLFVPHQANLRIIESVNERIGLDLERTALVLDKTGNTSAASIPLALAGAADAGRLREGDLVLLSGFGAGMTWASAVMRWGTRSVGR
jgi:3-oxoacyl-[acyl-carrier-protein] synthase-3